MKIYTRIVAAVLALVLLGLVMAWLAGLFSTTIAPEPVTLAPVPIDGQLVAVEAVEEPLVEQAPGTLRARYETVISARITGTIASMTVRAGDSVNRGDVLVRLDSRELETRVLQQRESVSAAQARLSEARPDYNRISELYDRGIVPRAELDRVEAALRSAEAELQRARQALAEAETALSYAIIEAPISGRVADRYADPGDTAMPGMPLLQLYDPASLRLEANVPESIGTALVVGQPLRAHIDAPDIVLAATVDEIVPLAEPGSRTFLVKATLPHRPNLYPGMFGRLLVPIGIQTRLYIPVAALYSVGQIEFVYVPGDNGPLRRYVRTGRRTEDQRVEILSGLSPGEQVIIDTR